MAEFSYKTIETSGESNYRVLGSRHIGTTYHVKTEEQIKSIIDQLWKDHHNATHICYAWRLGWDKSRYRQNDDGEPSGTAGKPIYGQIQSADLTNVLIAVIRYYGGTKLGTGGLIDAYKTASKMAIDASTIIEVQVKDHFELTFGYDAMPQVMKMLKDADMEKLNADFGEICKLEFLLGMEKRSWFEAEFEKLNGVSWVHLGRA
ncbi:MAG: YigZ family protein [Flavobacteriales bacterium]|nr:YigZ family protein [Flavobacteriales bacterium]